MFYTHYPEIVSIQIQNLDNFMDRICIQVNVTE